jgi:hypothetical protein
MALSKEQCVNATHGTIFYHAATKNADGTPLRARVNGKCRTWKKLPDEFMLPMKHGLRDCFYITHNNADEWCITECAVVVEGP